MLTDSRTASRLPDKLLSAKEVLRAKLAGTGPSFPHDRPRRGRPPASRQADPAQAVRRTCRGRVFSRCSTKRRRARSCGYAPRPGAGKTTLVASYLEARHRRHLWYQYDVGDADTRDVRALPAHRRAAARRQGGGGVAAFHVGAAAGPRALRPQLLPRSLLGLAQCRASSSSTTSTNPTRRPSSARHSRRDSTRSPTGSRSSSISRADPPPEFARLVASGRIARIDETELRCTEDEAQAILGGQPVDREQLLRIQRQSDGWVAALVLLARALSPPRRHARRIAGRRQGRDLPVLRGRDLQRRSTGEPARADAERDTAVDHRIGSRRAERQRRSAAPARIPVSPSPVHRSAPRRAGHVSLPRAVPRVPDRGACDADAGRGAARRHRARRPSRRRTRRCKAKHSRCFAMPANGRRCARSFTRTRSNGRARAARRRCRTGSKRCRQRCARAIRGSSTGSAARGSSSSRTRAVPRSSVRTRRSARPAIVGARRLRCQRDRQQLLLRVGDLHAARSLVARAQAAVAQRRSGHARSCKRIARARGTARRTAAAQARRRGERAMRATPRRAHRRRERSQRAGDGGSRSCSITSTGTPKARRAPGLVARIEPILRKPEVTPLMQVWWAVAVLALALHQWTLRGSDRSHDRGPRRRGAIRPRASPVRHRPPGGRCARQQGRSRGGQGTPRRHGAALVADATHALALLSAPAIDPRAAPRAQQGGADIAERALAMVRELDIPSLQMPHFFARLAWARAAMGDREGASRALDEAMARANRSIARCSRSGACYCRSRPT